jgi:hypothetical protein
MKLVVHYTVRKFTGYDGFTLMPLYEDSSQVRELNEKQSKYLNENNNKSDTLMTVRHIVQTTIDSNSFIIVDKIETV